MKKPSSQKEGPPMIGSDKRETQPGCYLTGQVIAASDQIRLTPQDLGAWHLGIFDQPKK